MTGGGGGERFRRADRLRSSKDFRRVSREGARVASRSFVLLVASRPEALVPLPRHCSRLGLTVSRRVGSAVVRNRVKRRVREWFRRHRGHIPKGKDIVIIARPSAARCDTAAIERELGAAFGQVRSRVAC